MIWRVLRKNISVGQIIGYAVANFIGLTIVLSAVRFYGDVSAALSPDASSEGLVGEDYLVLSKPVSIFNTLSGSTTEFSQRDIDELKQQPWVADVGAFSAADFNVTAAVNFAGQGLQTFMFMESIPDSFVDVRPADWHFDEEEGTSAVVPIILSKDYLALYNFGFAASRGLPQISEGVISQVPIILQMSGNGHVDQYRARIVGFSSRLNTIAVPDNFMSWANERYSTKAKSAPSRLIVKVNRPGAPEISEYIDRKGYEVAGDKLDTGRVSYFLTILTTIVISIGAIISALALFILMLSIHLLLQKNREKISNLLMLGYSPSQVSAGYYRLIGGINALVLLLSVAAMFVASSVWEGKLAALQIEASSPLCAIITGVAIVLVVTAVNFVAIARAVRRTFR